MTSGSRYSTRFVRPGHSVVPRGGLLLILFGAALGVAFGCSEQPLVAVERAPTATGGTGTGGKGNPSGGWFGTGGSGEDGGAPECLAKAGSKCGAGIGSCCLGMRCESDACCKLDDRECDN
ncbi:MAG: hypothetical protein ACM3ZE_27410, partial [Myxococcales bacterium]